MVLIKILDRQDTDNHSLIAMGQEEAFVLQQLDHPGVPKKLSQGKVCQLMRREAMGLDDLADRFYIALEYQPGKDLGFLLEAGHRFQPAEAAHIVRELCTSLVHVHERHDELGQPLQIIHRDVCDRNVLISAEGEVKLLDFGAAVTALPRHRDQVDLFTGHPSYAPPEALRKNGTMDQRADLYAAGLVLFVLLVNKHPFLAATTEQTINNICTMDPRVLEEQLEQRKVQRALAATCVKALAPDPKERFQTAREMREELSNFLVLEHAPRLSRLPERLAEVVQPILAVEQAQELDPEVSDESRPLLRVLPAPDPQRDTVQLNEDDMFDEEELPMSKADVHNKQGTRPGATSPGGVPPPFVPPPKEDHKEPHTSPGFSTHGSGGPTSPRSTPDNPLPYSGKQAPRQDEPVLNGPVAEQSTYIPASPYVMQPRTEEDSGLNLRHYGLAAALVATFIGGVLLVVYGAMNWFDDPVAAAAPAKLPVVEQAGERAGEQALKAVLELANKFKDIQKEFESDRKKQERRHKAFKGEMRESREVLVGVDRNQRLLTKQLLSMKQEQNRQAVKLEQVGKRRPRPRTYRPRRPRGSTDGTRRRTGGVSPRPAPADPPRAAADRLRRVAEASRARADIDPADPKARESLYEMVELCYQVLTAKSLSYPPHERANRACATLRTTERYFTGGCLSKECRVEINMARRIDGRLDTIKKWCGSEESAVILARKYRDL